MTINRSDACGWWVRIYCNATLYVAFPKAISRLYNAHIKGQLISKCPYEKSVWTKYQNISKISTLKTESIFLQTEHRLSFCVNLEVVNFQGRNIYVGILSKLIFHKDILKLTDL